MKNKTIKFYPEKEEYSFIFDPPELASKNIPNWYKEQSAYTNGKKEVIDETGLFNSTVKTCMPVFDIITAGYVIKTPADINVGLNEEGYPNFTWAINNYTCIQSHGVAQYDKLKISNEFYNIGYKFINPWIVRTPKGYSSIFINPTHRDDLPFYCLPAIVDTDKHPISVNFPFLMRKGFQGVIPMGTPMIQVIPFKRDVWNSEVLDHNEDFRKEWGRAERKIQNRYKTFFRSKKEWN